MKQLFLLERTEIADWDEMRAMVICANSNSEAREVANKERKHKFCEDPGIWLSDKTSTCVRIGVARGIKFPGLVLGDFKAG